MADNDNANFDQLAAEVLQLVAPYIAAHQAQTQLPKHNRKRPR